MGVFIWTRPWHPLLQPLLSHRRQFIWYPHLNYAADASPAVWMCVCAVWMCTVCTVHAFYLSICSVYTSRLVMESIVCFLIGCFQLRQQCASHTVCSLRLASWLFVFISNTKPWTILQPVRGCACITVVFWWCQQQCIQNRFWTCTCVCVCVRMCVHECVLA